MGDVEAAMYERANGPYGEEDVLARKVLRNGTKMCRDCYRYNGQIYWIVGGKVLTREQGAKLEDERRREGRAFHPSDRDVAQRKGYG